MVVIILRLVTFRLHLVLHLWVLVRTMELQGTEHNIGVVVTSPTIYPIYQRHITWVVTRTKQLLGIIGFRLRNTRIQTVLDAIRMIHQLHHLENNTINGGREMQEKFEKFRITYESWI